MPGIAACGMAPAARAASAMLTMSLRYRSSMAQSAVRSGARLRRIGGTIDLSVGELALDLSGVVLSRRRAGEQTGEHVGRNGIVLVLRAVRELDAKRSLGRVVRGTGKVAAGERRIFDGHFCDLEVRMKAWKSMTP